MVVTKGAALIEVVIIGKSAEVEGVELKAATTTATLSRLVVATACAALIELMIAGTETDRVSFSTMLVDSSSSFVLDHDPSGIALVPTPPAPEYFAAHAAFSAGSVVHSMHFSVVPAVADPLFVKTPPDFEDVDLSDCIMSWVTTPLAFVLLEIHAPALLQETYTAHLL